MRRPAHPTGTVISRWYQAALNFVAQGFLHILEGTDHLLFILCLVIPFRRWRPLILIITSFTVAHSITLVASALGLSLTDVSCSGAKTENLTNEQLPGVTPPQFNALTPSTRVVTLGMGGNDGNLFGTLDRAKFIFRDALESVRRLVELKVDPAALGKNPWRYRGAPGTLWRLLPRRVRS